jgi:hypothetical protein
MHPERMCRPNVVCNVQNNSVTILALHRSRQCWCLVRQGMCALGVDASLDRSQFVDWPDCRQFILQRFCSDPGKGGGVFDMALSVDWVSLVCWTGWWQVTKTTCSVICNQPDKHAARSWYCTTCITGLVKALTRGAGGGGSLSPVLLGSRWQPPSLPPPHRMGVLGLGPPPHGQRISTATGHLHVCTALLFACHSCM